MKVLPYLISKKAISDLEEIWLCKVDKWSIQQADRYYNLIFDEIAFICKTPGQVIHWTTLEKTIVQLK